LEEAIRLHSGEARSAMDQFKKLSFAEQGQLVALMKTLRAP
jgi:hypothetical protein